MFVVLLMPVIQVFAAAGTLALLAGPLVRPW